MVIIIVDLYGNNFFFVVVYTQLLFGLVWLNPLMAMINTFWVWVCISNGFKASQWQPYDILVKGIMLCQYFVKIQGYFSASSYLPNHLQLLESGCGSMVGVVICTTVSHTVNFTLQDPRERRYIFPVNIFRMTACWRWKMYRYRRFKWCR